MSRVIWDFFDLFLGHFAYNGVSYRPQIRPKIGPEEMKNWLLLYGES
jgi:hypothetical protein